MSNTEKESQNPTPSVGIPSVAGNQSRSGQSKNLFLLLIFTLFIVGAIAFGFYQKKMSKAPERPQETENRVFSGKSLTLPPVSEIQPPEPILIPEVKEEKKEEIVPLEKEKEPQPVFLAPPPAVPTLSQTGSTGPIEEKKEPTLAEKRNMAPMMGEVNGNGSGGTEKGLAQTFREEGYESGSGVGGKLGNLLTSVSTPPVKAMMMPDRNLLLAKGTFIDCVLETRLDTTVPGMTSCVLPRDIYSANGKVLLLERGSKAIGEYKGAVENGLNRIFVLWTQIQTPKGVRIHLDSPATDSLGGAGMAGDIDYHWWAKFGNALLFTLVQDAFEFGMNKQSENNGGVNYYQNSEDGMKEIIREAMRQSGNIPPTLTKNQGERIGIFVARDVDFSTVYKLSPMPMR